MKAMSARARSAGPGNVSEYERSLHGRIVDEAVAQFRDDTWRLVVNAGRNKLYGVAPGVYPDIVALDGTDTGVAWVLEVATPATITDEMSWERWRRTAGTRLPCILAVPSGAGRVAQRVSELLSISFGLIYEYSLTLKGVAFALPHPRTARTEAP